jgi:hypothetical protein
MFAVISWIVSALAHGDSPSEVEQMVQWAGRGRGTLFPARAVAAVLAAFAASIHFAVAPDHFAVAFAFGAFMVGVGAAQLAVGFLLLLRPSRSVVFATIVLAIAIIAVYAASRTTGLPVGPTPWAPEAIEQIDVASKVTELLLLADLAYLARAWPGRAGPAAP